MKNRLKTKRTEPLLLALLGVLLMISFQNCSNSMSFDGSAASLTKSAAATDPTNGDGQDPTAVVNPPPSNEDDDLDTDIDYDHNGRRIAFSCVTGARHGWSEAELANANDLALKDRMGLVFLYKKPLRNVFVSNIQGSVGIHNAWRTTEYTNLKSIVSALRSVEVKKASQIEAEISSTATMQLDELTNVKAGFICASGSEIGKVSNLQGLFMKIRGRSSLSAAHGHADEISNLRGTFMSIAKLDVTKLSNVEGELIIRDADIEELSDVRGGLTLINTRVKVLKNIEGVLRVHNATIASRENVNAAEVRLTDIKRRP